MCRDDIALYTRIYTYIHMCVCENEVAVALSSSVYVGTEAQQQQQPSFISPGPHVSGRILTRFAARARSLPHCVCTCIRVHAGHRLGILSNYRGAKGGRQCRRVFTFIYTHRESVPSEGERETFAIIQRFSAPVGSLAYICIPVQTRGTQGGEREKTSASTC